MDFIRRIRKVDRSSVNRKSIGTTERVGDDAAVARSVLSFLSYALTNGAEELSYSYSPEKTQEFVLVSEEIVGALKREYENRFANDSVVMLMKVNYRSKRVELTQVGRDVMLSLDNTTTRISSITLTELYANIRNDMIKHPEIYGKDRQLTAMSCPEPR